jgi:hypothetical protein
MSVYDDFEDARMNHLLFGNGSATLAAATAQMKADPNFSQQKYEEAIFRSEKTVEAYHQLCRALAEPVSSQSRIHEPPSRTRRSIV